jgi:hypothetical protein
MANTTMQPPCGFHFLCNDFTDLYQEAAARVLLGIQLRLGYLLPVAPSKSTEQEAFSAQCKLIL